MQAGVFLPGESFYSSGFYGLQDGTNAFNAKREEGQVEGASRVGLRQWAN